MASQTRLNAETIASLTAWAIRAAEFGDWQEANRISAIVLAAIVAAQ